MHTRVVLAAAILAGAAATAARADWTELASYADALMPGAQLQFDLQVPPASRLHVELVGANGVDLDMHLFAENGDHLCSSMGPRDEESCDWRNDGVDASRAIHVVVENLGAEADDFALTATTEPLDAAAR